ncbi:alpha-2-macroglobulin [Roseiarcaceae bacterium H3SJ34-1]|uniref:alpha-2-macroglobulin family protein n=1 Tax=Terripilifer ovatus TaxID=3032367 RepID=UPI003AB9296C|nr:alpha-2-macroglobulin [Roseiarcaceae bacterium H3SJ34-1]
MRKMLRGLITACALLVATSAFAQKAYVREDLASNVVRLEEQIRKDSASLAGRNPADLRRSGLAMIARAPVAALAPLGAAIVAAPKDGQAWLDYARAARAAALNDSNQSWRWNQMAANAAYGAYQRFTSKPDEATALSLIGEINGSQSLYRLALNAYRASLDASDNRAIRATYEDMRAKYGFRILDYKVDNDAASPRVCFQFSEPLARGKVDFAPFVAISGAANGAITTEDQQLCVEGLKHGEKYAIVVRQGLPSSVGENLLKNSDYEIYVKDRTAQVRFTGKNYVLPRLGQEGIPVVSVNTPKIAVDVLRIGDRNLVPTVRSDDFMSQLGGYRARQIIENQGVKVWTGTLDAKVDLNKDVVTAFPILDAVGKMEPGVYVMLARAGEKPVSQSVTSDDDDSDSYDSSATQWFVVSDLGLTSFSGDDGVHVFVRSLASAAPLSSVEVRLLARNNEVLATQTTGADGHLRFDAGLARGTGGMAPGVIIASDRNGDYGFLDLVQAPFDLTDRGVKGRTATKALDAYVYSERGVYRSGETVNISALLRDGRGVSQTGLPLTLVLKRPDGVEYKRALLNDEGLGGRAWSVALLSGVATGTWRVQAYADPKSPAIGETTFLVEDYVPERLDFTLTPKDKVLVQGEDAQIDAVARYLYGAPGSDLEITGEIAVQAADSIDIPGLKGFTAGLQDEDFETVRNDIDGSTTTDAQGKATVSIPVPEVDAARPVEARILLRAGESGGRAVERVVTLPVRSKNGLIAVKKNFDDLSEGATATFDVAAVSADGQRVPAKGLQWTLYRVSNDYQWYNNDGRWGFERLKSSRKIADGRIDVATGEAAHIGAAVGWGAHRLELRSDDGTLAPTSITFNVGWSGDVSAETPDLLEVTLDKTDYKPGDQMKVRIASRFNGKATVAVVGDKVQDIRLADVVTGDNEVSIPVKAEWGAGAYAVAMAHRPLDQAAKRMPGRALGLAWFQVDSTVRKLDVAIDAPEKMEPRRSLTMPIKLTGLAAGEEAYVTVAAVDIGILNLTRYESPNPTSYFFGQRQLSTEIRDLYGLLIDGMQGSRGAIRSGGDAAGRGLEGNRPTQEPLARYSGVVKVGADGVARVTFDIPAFNGAMRVMAVGWTRNKVGSASKDVIVRDPVVAQATLPRFLSLGDRSQFHVQVDNVEGPAGDYVIDLDVRGPVSVDASALRRTVKLAQGGKTQFNIPVSGAGIGRAELDLKLTGPNVTAAQTLAVNVQPGSAELYRRVVRPLPAGGSVSISNDLLADFLPGSGAVSVAVTPYGGIDVPALLQALDRYPYGCSEQTVSRALPLLYVNKLASQQLLALDTNVDERVKGAIERVLSRQNSAGAFGLWSAANAGDDLWLDAFVSDFLTRARENKYDVPQRSFDQALDRLRNQVVNAGEIKTDDAPGIAYAIYVLARNGRPVMGDLRYLADTKLASFNTPLARAQIAAALAMLGDRGRAQEAFASAAKLMGEQRRSRFSRADYGSRLRDSAGILTLAAETDGDRSLLSLAGLAVQEERAATGYTSTQENTWMVLAAQALAKEAQGMQLTVNGAPQTGALYRTWRGFSLDQGAVDIGNPGQAPAQIVITTSGHPTVPEAALSQGYQVERNYFKLDGKPVDLAQVKQNDRMVVVLKVTELEAAYARLLLVDHLPAGLEIDNPKLFDGGSVEGLAFAKATVDPTHEEYLDDRFVAAFERNGRDKATFNIAYIVRAVTPGRYVLPPATIEDMYRPERFGRTGTGTFVINESAR